MAESTGHVMPKRSRSRTYQLLVSLFVVGAGYLMVSSGHGLIEVFRLWATQRQVEQVVAVLRLYDDRYGTLPGDDPDAQQRYGRPPALLREGPNVMDRSGNHRFDGRPFDIRNPTGEPFAAWRDLRFARLLDGPAERIGLSSLPETPMGGLMALGSNALGLDQALCLSHIPASAAQRLERALEDDGQPASGHVRAIRQDDGLTVPRQAPEDTAPYGTERSGSSYIVCLALAL